MNFEQQLEDLFTRIFTRAIKNALQNLPLEVVQNAPVINQDLPAKDKKTRKTKEEKALEETAVLKTPPEVAEKVETATALVKELPANVVPFVSPASVVIAPTEATRAQVSAALITVAKSAELGPSSAFGVLQAYSAKEVKDLNPENYLAVVASCAVLLKITVADALKLDPTK
jgi:hypothetical protein